MSIAEMVCLVVFENSITNPIPRETCNAACLFCVPKNMKIYRTFQKAKIKVLERDKCLYF
ncbi:hypothetical protein PMEGAS228_56030 [Priestia megaterium]